MTTPLGTATHLTQLENEYGILHMLFHRDHNQHRGAVWWRYLNILHRRVRLILKLSYDSRNTTNSLKIAKKNREIIENVRYLNRRGLVRTAYFHFHSILALGQFVSLGFTLLACLSKISELLGQICGKEVAILAFKIPAVVKRSIAENDLETGVGEELGEEWGEELGLEVIQESAEELNVPLHPGSPPLSLQNLTFIETFRANGAPSEVAKSTAAQDAAIHTNQLAKRAKPSKLEARTGHILGNKSSTNDVSRKRTLEDRASTDEKSASENQRHSSGTKQLKKVKGAKKQKKKKSSIDSIFGGGW